MSDARDKSPWFGTAEEGLRWILRPGTCVNEQVELVARKALERIEALEQEHDKETSVWRETVNGLHYACDERDKRIQALEQEVAGAIRFGWISASLDRTLDETFANWDKSPEASLGEKT